MHRYYGLQSCLRKAQAAHCASQNRIRIRQKTQLERHLHILNAQLEQELNRVRSEAYLGWVRHAVAVLEGSKHTADGRSYGPLLLKDPKVEGLFVCSST